MKTKHDKVAEKMGHKTLNGVCVDAEKHKPATHTPGPWNYEKGTDKQWHVSSETEYPIFTVLCGRPEAHANARLIAAAPELFGGIVALRDRLQTGDDNAGDGRNRAEIALCDWLIAKAEGHLAR